MGEFSIDGHRYHDKHKHKSSSSSSRSKHRHRSGESGHRHHSKHHKKSENTSSVEYAHGNAVDFTNAPAYNFGDTGASAPQQTMQYDFGGNAQSSMMNEPEPAPQETYDGGASLLDAALMSGKTLDEIDEDERLEAKRRRAKEKREREKQKEEERRLRHSKRYGQARMRQRQLQRSSSRKRYGNDYDDRRRDDHHHSSALRQSHGSSSHRHSGHRSHGHRSSGHHTVHRRVVRQMFVPKQIYNETGKVSAHLGCWCMILVIIAALTLASGLFSIVYDWRCTINDAVLTNTFTLDTADLFNARIDVNIDFGVVEIKQDKIVAPGTVKIISAAEGAGSVDGFTFTPLEADGLNLADGAYSIRIAQKSAPNPLSCNHSKVSILVPYGGDELIDTDIRVVGQYVHFEAQSAITRSVTIIGKYTKMVASKFIVAGSLYVEGSYRIVTDVDELSVGWITGGFITDATFVTKGMYQTLAFNNLIAPDTEIVGSFGSQFYDGITVGPNQGFVSRLDWFGYQDMFLYGTEDYKGSLEILNSYGYLSFSQFARDGIVVMSQATSSMMPGSFAGDINASEDAAENSRLTLQSTFGKTFTMIKN